MKRTLMAAVVALVCSSAFGAETFEEAWQTRWRPQVTGSLLSRRFEPQIKASAKEVWDVAQANVAPTLAGPLIAANKAIARVKDPAESRRYPARRWRRRGLFR